MSSQIKGGKKPLSQKPSFKPNLQDTGFGDALYIGPELKAELTAKGLEGRWIDYKLLADFGGNHKNQWRAYKPDNKEANNDYGVMIGNDPHGLLRRGSLVFAVKPVEKAEAHREMNRQKAERYSAMVRQQNKEELKEASERAGVKLKFGDEDTE
jgi:hypothetical protein